MANRTNRIFICENKCVVTDMDQSQCHRCNGKMLDAGEFSEEKARALHQEQIDRQLSYSQEFINGRQFGG